MTTTTDAPSYPANWREQREKLADLVGRRVSALQTQYCRTDPVPSARAALAQLRRAALGLGAGNAITSTDAFAVDTHTHVPEDCYPLNARGNPIVLDDEPTQAERAVHTAMTLYAVHQQSRTEKMHGVGERPGMAFAKLAWRKDTSEEAVRRRFGALATATTFVQLSHQLRTMTRLLRDGRVPMDYGRLASDLFTWQTTRGRDRVRLSWSRDFENHIQPRSDKDKPKEDQ